MKEVRLIDADALYEKAAEREAQALHMCEKTMNDEDLTEWRRWLAILKERSAFKFDIADAPTIDAVEVVHGKWKRKMVDDGFNADWVCSECGYRVMTDFVSYSYCPNCGAKMGVTEL